MSEYWHDGKMRKLYWIEFFDVRPQVISWVGWVPEIKAAETNTVPGCRKQWMMHVRDAIVEQSFPQGRRRRICIAGGVECPELVEGPDIMAMDLTRALANTVEAIHCALHFAAGDTIIAGAKSNKHDETWYAIAWWESDETEVFMPFNADECGDHSDQRIAIQEAANRARRFYGNDRVIVADENTVTPL